MNKYIPHVVNEDSDIETNFESLLLPDDLVETKTLHIHTHTHTRTHTRDGGKDCSEPAWHPLSSVTFLFSAEPG